MRAAKIVRELSGQKGTEGLTELQKKIYEYIKLKKKATAKEITAKFRLTSKEL